MEGYQERKKKEFEELSERVEKLHAFLGKSENLDNLDEERLRLLTLQYHYMVMYQHILRLRCNAEGIL